MMYTLSREILLEGQTKTFSWDDLVSTVIVLEGEVAGLTTGMSVILSPNETLKMTAVVDSVVTVMKRPDTTQPSPLHAYAELVDGVWLLNSIEGKSVFLKENNKQYEKATKAVTGDYPPLEKDTWPTQEREAKAWVADNINAETPWIDIAAEQRGIDREEYIRRTLVKALQFSMVSAYLTGIRQKYEDNIKDGIAPTIDYTIPASLYQQIQQKSYDIMTQPTSNLGSTLI